MKFPIFIKRLLFTLSNKIYIYGPYTRLNKILSALSPEHIPRFVQLPYALVCLQWKFDLDSAAYLAVITV